MGLTGRNRGTTAGPHTPHTGTSIGKGQQMGRTSIIITAVCVAVVLSACGDDDGDDGGAGDDAAGDGSGGVAVSLSEWTVLPDVREVAAGDVSFTADNEGTEPHELVIVRAVSLADLPLGDDGAVDEAGIAEEDFIGEIEEFAAGESRDGTFTLDAGTYALFCNIVETDEGEVESHYQLGMATTLTVTE